MTTLEEVAQYAAARFPREERAQAGSPDLKTCLHEAGHAVVYAALGMQVTEMRLDATGGATLAKDPDPMPPLRQCVALVIAGEVAAGLVPSYSELPERRFKTMHDQDAPDLAKLATAKTLGMTEQEYGDGVALAQQIIAERKDAVTRLAAALYHERKLPEYRVADLTAETRATNTQDALRRLEELRQQEVTA